MWNIPLYYSTNDWFTFPTHSRRSRSIILKTMADIVRVCLRFSSTPTPKQTEILHQIPPKASDVILALHCRGRAVRVGGVRSRCGLQLCVCQAEISSFSAALPHASTPTPGKHTPTHGERLLRLTTTTKQLIFATLCPIQTVVMAQWSIFTLTGSEFNQWPARGVAKLSPTALLLVRVSNSSKDSKGKHC